MATKTHYRLLIGLAANPPKLYEAVHGAPPFETLHDLGAWLRDHHLEVEERLVGGDKALHIAKGP